MNIPEVMIVVWPWPPYMVAMGLAQNSAAASVRSYYMSRIYGRSALMAKFDIKSPYRNSYNLLT